LIRRDEVEHLRDAAAHDAFLRDVLARSLREVQVVTPWLTRHALVESGLIPALSAAVARGIALTVYTDHTLNAHRVARDRRAIADLARALDTLREVGADLIEVFDVHSKIVMADNDLFCVGSFNWFSAARDGAYARHETSVAYKGPAVANEIAAMKASLHARMAR
jgi:phosphatidylserine/phosphatidylglycerophosphate/cardiolipin synthase-like enzyme